MEYGNHYLDPRDDEMSHNAPQPPTVPDVPGLPGVPTWLEDAVGAFAIFAVLYAFMAI